MSDDLKKKWDSPRLRTWVYVLGGCILAILIFNLGMLFEAERHESERVPPFNHAPGSFDEPFGMFSLPHEFIENGHGAIGTITNVALPLLTIQTRTGSIETIVVSTSTLVHTQATSTTFTEGEGIIVLGEPDAQGHIDAELIRLFPSPPSSTLEQQ